MNNESIKILRSKISIPLNKAIELLKKNNGDVVLSEQDFHDENIIEICKTTDCDEETAKKEYQICNLDVIKTAERINQKPVKIGTGKFSDAKIGFVLWPRNEKREFYKTEKRNDIFISTEDFNLVQRLFESVFPICNDLGFIGQESFDITGHNFLSNEICQLIVREIKMLKNNDEEVQSFLNKLINWFDDKLSYADYIVVYGNL